MNPKYSEGERVILQSVSQPESNGEYTIRQVVKEGEMYKCRHAGWEVINAEGLGYILEEIIDVSVAEDGTPIEGMWAESALRKKHEPSQMSFQSLIQSVNSPVSLEC